MPSLRRTASSPGVRSSPYSSGGLAVRGNGHRRSSGSETTNRRVLADIEWWKVTEGQCDENADQEPEDRNRGNQDIVNWDVSFGAGIPVTHIEAGVDHPVLLPLPWLSTEAVGANEISFEPPTAQFSGLSITPHTPIHRHRTLESSSSSLESTPEAVDTQLTVLDLDLSYLDVGLPSLPVQRRNRFGTLAPVLSRSYTFADCLSLKGDYASQYADFTISPLSSAPDFLN